METLIEVGIMSLGIAGLCISVTLNRLIERVRYLEREVHSIKYPCE